MDNTRFYLPSKFLLWDNTRFYLPSEFLLWDNTRFYLPYKFLLWDNTRFYLPSKFLLCTSLCTLFDLDKHLGSCCCVMVLVLLQLRAVSFNEDPGIQEFGISVGGKFEEVEARILDAPQLQYSVSKLYTTDSILGVPFVTEFMSREQVTKI